MRRNGMGLGAMRGRRVAQDGAMPTMATMPASAISDMQRKGRSSAQGMGLDALADNRARSRELQAQRNAAFRARQTAATAPNLYNPGADTQAVSAVFGNEIGMGNNDPYLLHQLRGGGYAVNRGTLDPTRVNLDGDYSKWIT